MSLRNKEHIRKLSKKSKNEKWKKYEKRKETDFSSNERDSLNQHENQERILFITIKLSENGNKDKELKNEL